MLDSNIGKIVNDALRIWKTPGAAVAIVRGDEVSAEGYGVREAGKPEPVTPETLFGIGSISKSFTTTAIAILADEGKVSWDDPVRNHVPFFRLADPVADANVTLRDLASHRSGAPRHDGLWYGTDWSTEEIVRRYGLAPMKHPFRTTYEYANIPFMAVGLAVAGAANSTWEEFVRNRILEPLKMTSANCRLDQAMKSPDHASPHVKKDGKMTPIPWCNLDREAAAGGINASVLDMSKWMRLHLSDGEIDGTRILSTESLREIHKPHTVIPTENPDKYGFDSGKHIGNYCLGLMTSDYRGHIILTHSGWVLGFISKMVLVPALDLGVVVLTNSTPEHTCGSISNGILDYLLGLPKRNWNADFLARNSAEKADAKVKQAAIVRQKRTRPSRKLEDYVGEYEHPAYGKVVVTMNDGALSMQLHSRSSVLNHFHFDVFSGKFDWDPFRLVFSLSVDGEIASAHFAEIDGVEFKRVKMGAL